MNRDKTKQPFSYCQTKKDIDQKRKKLSKQTYMFPPCSSWVAYVILNPYIFQNLTASYFTVKVEAEAALIKDEDGGWQCLWLLLLLIAERCDDEGLEEPSYLQDWLLIFLFSPSWTLSDATCETFVSFRPGGRTQLHRRPSCKGTQLKELGGIFNS